VHLIGGDKDMLAGQVGQKVQVSGKVDAKGPGLKKTIAGVAAAAAPVAGVAAGVATAGVATAAGAATRRRPSRRSRTPKPLRCPGSTWSPFAASVSHATLVEK
jgi:hypothetical protein